MSGPATHRELFERVRTHLLAQGRPSLDRSGGCVYRSPEGLRCAVGALIPDGAYHPGLEGLGASSDCVMDVLVDAGVVPAGCVPSSPVMDMLDSLQYVHDTCPHGLWAAALDRLESAGLTGEDWIPPSGRPGLTLAGAIVRELAPDGHGRRPE